MKIIAILMTIMLTLTNAACTTLQPVAATPDEVQRQLLAGAILKPGDRVRIVTQNDEVHQFRVKDVDTVKGVIVGRDENVAINQIVAVETREVSMGKTAVLTGGLSIGILYLIALAISPAILLGM